MKQYTEADGNFIVTVSYLLDLASRARDLFLSSKVDQKRKLISFVLSNVSLEGKKLVYKLNEPFDAIVQANKELIWLPGTDSNRRPTRYTLALYFYKEWTISSPLLKKLTLGVGRYLRDYCWDSLSSL